MAGPRIGIRIGRRPPASGTTRPALRIEPPVEPPLPRPLSAGELIAMARAARKVSDA